MLKTNKRNEVAEIAEQIGSSLMPDNDQWTNRFTVNSRTSSSVYVVAQRRSDASWGCSCPGWRHYRRCKHLKDILARLARVAERATAFSPAIQQMLTAARFAHLDLDVKPNKMMKPSGPKGRQLDFE